MKSFSRAFTDHAVTVEQQHATARFYQSYQDAPITIAYRPWFKDPDAASVADGGISFMPIVNRPDTRVVLKPGETAKISAKHPIESKQHLNNIILMLGTPYGLVVMHGREKDYHVNGKGIVKGPLPHLHSTASFSLMVLRVFKRKGWKLRGDSAIKEWIFSDHFEVDLLEQMAYDQKDGIAVNDGLPARRRAVHPAAKHNVSTQPVLTSHDVKGAKPQASRHRPSQPVQSGLHAGGYPA